MKTQSPEQAAVAANLRAHVQFALALLDAIHTAGPAGIAAGTLYAFSMGKCDLPAFEGAVRFLEGQNVIRKQGDLLISTVPRD